VVQFEGTQVVAGVKRSLRQLGMCYRDLRVLREWRAGKKKRASERAGTSSGGGERERK